MALLPFALILAVFALNWWLFRHLPEKVSMALCFGAGILFLAWALVETGGFWANLLFALFGFGLGIQKWQKLRTH